MRPASLIPIYQLLFDHFGHRGWWPAESKIEMIWGAILTQAVSWQNAEKALAALKERGLMDIQPLLSTGEEELSRLIKPALYHRQKAKKMKNMARFIYNEYEGSLPRMFAGELDPLRRQLLNIWGIGPETADSILLYAGEYIIFVVDAYTRRIFHRLGYVPADIGYRELQLFMQDHTWPELDLYQDYHAQIVALGSGYCYKSKPRCQPCPLQNICQSAHIIL